MRAGSSRGAAKRTPGGGIPAWRWRVTAPAPGALPGRQYPPGRVERALRCEPSVRPRRAARPGLSRHGTPAGRITTSEAIVPSGSPAAARASTKPASTSVRSAARSSAVTGARATRSLVRLPGSNPGLLAFAQPAKRTIRTIYLQKSQVHFRWQNSHRSSKKAPGTGSTEAREGSGNSGVILVEIGGAGFVLGVLAALAQRQPRSDRPAGR